MKYPASFIACLVVCAVLIGCRGYYSEIGGARKQLIVTQWDAFGYYLYLPATFIYRDIEKLDWAASIDQTYNVTGGDGMPVQHLDNGNNVCKYLGGVAILQAPLFALAHITARIAGYPADGFSPPYQYALAFGVLLYCMLAIFLLRHILLLYFTDRVTAVTLLLLCLATNFVQYAAVDNGLSHAWIFPLYVLVLFTTIRWHENASPGWACATGYIIGLATICRPTEAIMFTIPLLWNTHTKLAAQEKWRLVKTHRLHVVYAVLAGMLGILPQLLYWKAVTGSFIYDVGSKWMFLDPWFRVLAGWEKGWFIYTPVTIFFIIGMFFMKQFPFRKSVLVYCLLTIWIVIAWEDWQYGASYSTRALVQSYPVFALPLACLIARVHRTNWRPAVYVAGAYLIAVNLFQTLQYNTTILHYRDMNRQYYSRIYLNPEPSPIDMSLLDTKDWLRSEAGYSRTTLVEQNSPVAVHTDAHVKTVLVDTALPDNPGLEQWLKIEARILAPDRVWNNMLSIETMIADSVRRVAIRLDNPVGKRTGRYACYVRLPAQVRRAHLRLVIDPASRFDGLVEHVKITLLTRSLLTDSASPSSPPGAHAARLQTAY